MWFFQKTWTTYSTTKINRKAKEIELRQLWIYEPATNVFVQIFHIFNLLDHVYSLINCNFLVNKIFFLVLSNVLSPPLSASISNCGGW